MTASNRKAFSLLELMVVLAIMGLITLAVLGTYTLAQQGFTAIRNYNEIHEEGRMAVDFFSRDVRNAYSISSPGSLSVTLLQPATFSSNGGTITGTPTQIRYFYSSPSTSVIRLNQTTGETTTLSSNVSTVSFTYYNNQGTATTTTANIKKFQMEIVLKKQVMSNFQTEDYISGRVVMRNKNARE